MDTIWVLFDERWSELGIKEVCVSMCMICVTECVMVARRMSVYIYSIHLVIKAFNK
jgi:hypothetical protein